MSVAQTILVLLLLLFVTLLSPAQAEYGLVLLTSLHSVEGEALVELSMPVPTPRLTPVRSLNQTCDYESNQVKEGYANCMHINNFQTGTNGLTVIRTATFEGHWRFDHGRYEPEFKVICPRTCHLRYFIFAGVTV